MIELYTSATPNGRKISICLEELGLDYKVHPIELGKRQQKEDWFLKLNPNGRIPVIVDKGNHDFVLFESGAILMYLAEKTGELLPSAVNKKYDVIQWLMFQMSAVGPMQGQLHVFSHYFDEHLPNVIQRYERETLRIYQVLDDVLANQSFLAHEFSIADIATWPWVDSYVQAGKDLEPLSHLLKWYLALQDRPSFQKGNQVPPDAEDEEGRKQQGRDILV